MTNLDEHGRPEPPLAADETATLLGFLEYQRATPFMEVRGTGRGRPGATVAASSMTLGGMLKHLAYVEDLLVAAGRAARIPTSPGVPGRTTARPPKPAPDVKSGSSPIA
jgi:hypothetical protein